MWQDRYKEYFNNLPFKQFDKLAHLLKFTARLFLRFSCLEGGKANAILGIAHQTHVKGLSR